MKTPEEIREAMRLIEWWEHVPGGLLVGQTTDGAWQAAFQHSKLVGCATHGKTPLEAISKACDALREPNVRDEPRHE